MAEKKEKWPPLRQELSLHKGPSGLFGAPSWTLEDPVAHRFFRLGWLEFEVLSHWDLGDPEAVARAITAATTLSPTPEEVEKVFTFAVANNLILAQSPGDTARLAGQKKRGHVPWHKLAMKSYLFFRIPLVRPDRFLTRTYPYVQWMFTAPFLRFLTFAALLSFYLISRQWTEFADSLAALNTWGGWLMVGLALTLSKTIHELGHGYATKKMNLPVPAMGVALMCFSPVMWTDTTSAWKACKKDRLQIGLSGVFAEIVLATAASWLWLVLPPGLLRTAAFITASSTWVMTLMVNANPLMRYDGYYLLSDFWEAPSLQPRSSALGLWYLRRFLFGLADPAPEVLPFWWRVRFIIYAYISWVYRFFLFLGIALLVYHLFFKLLGLVLFLVEIVFFIIWPVFRELKVWWGRRADIWAQKRGRTTVVLAGLILMMAMWPWSGRIIAPGLLMAEKQTVIYAPIPAIIIAPPVNLRAVEAGEAIIKLQSPELEEEARSRKIESDNLAHKLANMSLDQKGRADYMVDLENYQGLLTDQNYYTKRLNQLTIRAPFSGTVVDVPLWAVAGQWTTPQERLGVLISKNFLVAAYVTETDIERLSIGDRGFFEPLGNRNEHLLITIVSIDASATRELSHPELASIYGGPLGVKPLGADRHLVPETAVYKVICQVQYPATSPRQSLAGMVVLKGRRQSAFTKVWHNSLGILIRESGL